jgi:GTP-binding protein EngB required for normal cell division
MENTMEHAKGFNFDALLGQLPACQADVLRLQWLCGSTLPEVVVLGKYNHGKSSLLNALVGQPNRFGVADYRKTILVEDCDAGGVRWVDTPGLGADVNCQDDQRAMDAACSRADVRLLVHSLKEGELDGDELALARTLQEEERQTGRTLLVVLTQLDELADEACARGIIAAIQAQLPQARVLAVSSVSYVKACAEQKKLLRAASRFDALLSTLQTMCAGVPERRRQEKLALIRRLDAVLEARESQISIQSRQLERQYHDRLAQFSSEMADVHARIVEKMSEANR